MLAGIILIILGNAINALTLVIEEVILTKYSMPVERLVGVEGIYGICFEFIWGMFFTYTLCFSEDLCGKQHYVADYALGFQDWILGGPAMFILGWLSILTITFFNYGGMLLTQNVSNVFRAIWDSCKTILVWVSHP
jgi:hypothetical protein